MTKAIPFKMYMLKTKNYNAIHRMKRVVEGRHWIGDSYNLFGDFYYFRKPNNYDKLISEMPF